MKVLICDDHAVFGESLAVVLRRTGITVTAVTQSLDEALQTLQRNPVDLGLLDVVYGNYAEADDGVLRWLPELRAAAPAAKFVLLSGQLNAGLALRARAAGVSGIAHKSGRVQGIITTVNRVHAGESVFDALEPALARGATPRNEMQRLAAFLTTRERQVLGLLVQGADTAALAKSLGVSWTTARAHIQSVLTKLGVHSRLEAATAAVREGLVSGAGSWLL